MPDNKGNKTIYNILYTLFIAPFSQLTVSFDTNKLDLSHFVSYNYYVAGVNEGGFAKAPSAVRRLMTQCSRETGHKT